MEPVLARDAAQMTIIVVQEANRWGQVRSDRVQSNMMRQIHYIEHIIMRPFARLHLSTPEGRRADPVLKFAFMIQLCVNEHSWPKFMSPCEQCGQPTGSWCEVCDNTHAVLCTQCEAANHTCHECESTMGG